MNNLKLEYSYIVKSIFHENLYDEKVESLYIESHKYLLNNFIINVLNVKLDIIIEKKLNFEAIEFFLRLKNKNNILTIKTNIILYIMESQKQYVDLFVNNQNKFLLTFLQLSIATLKSIFLAFQGYYLVRRYKLV